MKWQIEFSCDPASPGAARRAVREWISGCVASDLVSDVTLIVNELVTNSVLNGPDRPITVMLSWDSPTRVSGEVSDAGEATISMDTMSQPGLLESGVGLPLVVTLATDWGVHEGTADF